jgi:pimeloyl-ACP methyl ester carboxylesterase
MLRRRGLLLAMVLLMGGCGWTAQRNPSLPLNIVEARADWEAMEQRPVELDRPVVILSGYMDPGVVPHRLTPVMRRLTGDERVIGMAYPWESDFDSCRDRVVEFVDANFPSDDPDWTAEVDVIAVSMGGLVARYAAAEMPDRPEAKRLRIARLFTISTPHRGARLAVLPSWNRLQTGMRNGSDFLRRLGDLDDQHEYEMHCYVRLGDMTVGSANAAPEGQTPWWVANRFLQLPHSGAFDDPRIIADIARRLRNESPHATLPPARLPG